MKSSRSKSPAVPIIQTEWGPVSEPGRLQAAYNMRDDAALKERVIALLAKQLGSRERAEQEARRRYPEAFEATA